MAYRDLPPAQTSLSAELIWHIWNKGDWSVWFAFIRALFPVVCVQISADKGVMLRSKLLISLGSVSSVYVLHKEFLK